MTEANQGPPGRERLLAEVERAWAELDAALARIGPEATEREASGSWAWSVQDHLVHLTGWDRALAAMIDGRPVAGAMGVDPQACATNDVEVINAQLQRQGEGRSADLILLELRQTQDELRPVLAALDEADLDRLVADPSVPQPISIRHCLWDNEVLHYREHVAAMLAAYDPAGQRATGVGGGPAEASATDGEDRAGEDDLGGAVPVARLLAEVDAAWNEVGDLIDGASDEALAHPGPDGWAVKDILWHLAAWERSLLALLDGASRAEAVGIAPADYARLGTDGINDAILAQGRERSTARVRQESALTHASLRDRLAGLSDEDLRRPYAHYQPDEPDASDEPVIGWIAGNTFGHYREHVPAIGERLVGG